MKKFLKWLKQCFVTPPPNWWGELISEKMEYVSIRLLEIERKSNSTSYSNYKCITCWDADDGTNMQKLYWVKKFKNKTQYIPVYPRKYKCSMCGIKSNNLHEICRIKTFKIPGYELSG